ncbi:diphthine methyltransferase [Lepeophtheirus salmonis]|uniref:diphthine methyltransferase n=1 Tax=Lepeophtheirus salmonis TaxID=72036 RepID=UPI001AE2CD44|nr:diphthine methyltransferase-like [Lepeophtheirus salmonis]
MVVNCLSSWDTEYSADTVEWCTQPKYNDVFAVGTYQVDNDPNSSKFDGQSQRKGRLYLGEFKDEIDIKQTIETPAILDLKWSPNNQGALAAVNASGQLTIYSLKENISLEDAKSFNIDGNDLLILSLAWKHDRIALSDSGGYITVVSSDQLEPIAHWKSHDFEAWITTFHSFDSNLIFSGGDDLKLKGYDLRTGTHTFVCKEHSAGVTSLLSHPNDEYKLFSGSYDEKLREWDIRKMKSSINEVHMGGGVWRIKHNLNSGLLGTACMHNGFQFLLDGKISDSFMEHESLAYGIDWHESKSRIGASCSFYDHQLKIWEVLE